MAHTHSTIDTDKHFTIDPMTREIENESGKVVLIQYDHNSERFTFELPKTIEGHNMNQCNVVQVHYINLSAADGMSSEGVYEVDDLLTIGDNVSCSWLISGNATQHVGSLSFLLRFACVDDDGTITYAWHTAIYKGVFVATGLNNAEAVVAANADILEKWRADIYERVQQQIDAAVAGAMVLEFSTTIPANGWISGSDHVRQQVSVEGLLANDNPTPGLDMSVPASEEARKQLKEEASKIYRMRAISGALEVYASEAPVVNIPVLLQVVR